MNIEDLFLEEADKCWNQANKTMGLISDAIPETGEQISFVGPGTKAEISLCIKAVIGWAISLESYTNLAWNSYEKTKIEPEKLRSLNTYEKIKMILRHANIDLSNKNWLSDIKDLFSLRNYLIHYKETITYVGFSFAPKYQKNLNQASLIRYRLALEKVIYTISKITGIGKNLLDGEYELFYYDE